MWLPFLSPTKFSLSIPSLCPYLCCFCYWFFFFTLFMTTLYHRYLLLPLPSMSSLVMNWQQLKLLWPSLCSIFYVFLSWCCRMSSPVPFRYVWVLLSGIHGMVEGPVTFVSFVCSEGVWKGLDSFRTTCCCCCCCCFLFYWGGRGLHFRGLQNMIVPQFSNFAAWMTQVETSQENLTVSNIWYKSTKGIILYYFVF